MEFREQAVQHADNGDLVFENSSTGENKELSPEVIDPDQQSEHVELERHTPEAKKVDVPSKVEGSKEAEEQSNETSNEGVSRVDEEVNKPSNVQVSRVDEERLNGSTTVDDEAVLTFDEVSLDGSSSIDDGPGYKSLIHPSKDSQDSNDESADEAGADSPLTSSSGSSFDSSSSSDYSTGSSKRENSEEMSQSLRLRPKKITLSLDLRETSSETSATDLSDVGGVVRKDRTNRSSTENTYNSCNDVTQISSEESLSVFTDGSSASEFRSSEREDHSVPLSSSSSASTKSTTDIESGGIKDTRPRNRAGLAAGFVSLLGLGRFWLSPAKAKCRYDTSAEKRKLTDPDKSKATVAEIYPWIKEEAEPKRKITNLAQLVKDNKRKGLSKRHNLILDLTEEVRTLRAEVEDVLFYDKERKAKFRTAIYELYMQHYRLKEKFSKFLEQIDVDSAIMSDGFEYNPPTPDFVKSHARIRRIEFYIRRFFVRPNNIE